MKQLHLTKVAAAIGIGLCLVSFQAMAQSPQPEAPVFDAATLNSLEQQLMSLDALIDQQSERLVALHNRISVETDPVKRQQIDALIARLTGLLDALEEQRDRLDGQITVLRPMVAQSGSEAKN